jgi:hypothetical protein
MEEKMGNYAKLYSATCSSLVKMQLHHFSVPTNLKLHKHQS